jgi:hypothetical protein
MSPITIDYRDAQRETIRKSLKEITNDIGMALRDAGLMFPIYLVVPNSGDAIVSVVTSLDPSDDDWSRAMEIVCSVIQEKIGSGKLHGRALTCAAINTPMISAYVTADGNPADDYHIAVSGRIRLATAGFGPHIVTSAFGLEAFPPVRHVGRWRKMFPMSGLRCGEPLPSPFSY